MISRFTLRRCAKLEAERRLELTNPSGKMPDHSWDRPEMDPEDPD